MCTRVSIYVNERKRIVLNCVAIDHGIGESFKYLRIRIAINQRFLIGGQSVDEYSKVRKVAPIVFFF